MPKRVSMTYNFQNMNLSIQQNLLLDDTFMQSIGTEGIRIVQKILSPLKRSGELEGSWKWEKTTRGIDIYSEDSAAQAIAEGFTQPPPKDKFMSWMSSVPDFQGMADKKKARIAYAIRLHMASGGNPGVKSTLGALPPSGLRRFDYLSRATTEITDVIRKKFIV